MKATCVAGVLALIGMAAHAGDLPASPAASGADEGVPRKVDCRPQYPAAALRAQVQGVTTLAFHVNAAGQLTQVDIVRSSGKTREHRMLDIEAARALSRCPFKATLDAQGQPADNVFEVNYTWRLE